ncbi:hypothetical protein V491_08681, partial [Pseudogymnoascus sp. VKM F-3775]
MGAATGFGAEGCDPSTPRARSPATNINGCMVAVPAQQPPRMGPRISEEVVAVARAGLKKGVHNSPSNAFIRRDKFPGKWNGGRSSPSPTHSLSLTSPDEATRLPNRLKILAVKDNISTQSFETTCASNFLKDYKAPFDADVVEKMYEHGAVAAGKTNMDEFGMGSHSVNSYYGAVTNAPPFEAYSAGGSSGGSAQA